LESLYLLIPLSVVLVFLIGIVFWCAVESGQFEDLEGPAHHILMDDDAPAGGRRSPSARVSPSYGTEENPGFPSVTSFPSEAGRRSP
jgi:cbb3-type cytochrome oxidase maturation protein